MFNFSDSPTVPKNFKEYFITTLWFLLLLFLLFSFFAYQKVDINGQSMEPTFSEKEYLLVNRIDKKLQRGGVVTFYSSLETFEKTPFIQKLVPFLSTQNNKILLKRVVALPGESIEIIGSKIIIYNKEYPNGAVLTESYISQKVVEASDNKLLNQYYYTPKTLLGENEYFILGDNRTNSSDSRDLRYGPFHVDALFGVAKIQYWPWSEKGFIKNPEYSFQEISPELQATREALNK